MLMQSDRSELRQYLLMERISPPEIKAYMMRRGQLREGLTVSELGIYSSVFIDTNKPDLLENRTFGRLMRTKGIESDEGGINTGFSVINQPWLISVSDSDLTKN